MPREPKYSKQLKLEIIKKYLSGTSALELKNFYGLSKRGDAVIRVWVHRYEVSGEKAFDSSKRNKSYSKEFKEKVIKEYLNGEGSIEYLTNTYGISSQEIVRQWIIKYNKGIEIKDYNPKGDVYTMKSRKTTLDERLEIVKYVLDNNYDYKGASDKYSVRYSNVYNWVKKYNELGHDGLKDLRGRPSNNPKHELTELEKKDLEIDRLKRELNKSQLVIEVLKKNAEIRKEMEMDSRSLGKKINTKP